MLYRVEVQRVGAARPAVIAYSPDEADAAWAAQVHALLHYPATGAYSRHGTRSWRLETERDGAFDYRVVPVEEVEGGDACA